MSSQSKGDKLKALYKKALSTSLLLLNLSKEEEDSLRGSLRPGGPIISEQPSRSKTSPPKK